MHLAVPPLLGFLGSALSSLLALPVWVSHEGTLCSRLGLSDSAWLLEPKLAPQSTVPGRVRGCKGKRQAQRMKHLADGVVLAGKVAVADFICPT